jgi:hypothetical protein
VQAQGRYRGIQGLDDMKRLDLNCCFKLVEELLNTWERRPWDKGGRTNRLRGFPPFP